MKKAGILFLMNIALSFLMKCYGQIIAKPDNLITDGGFEEVTCVGYPFNSMKFNIWYSPTISPTDYMVINACLGYSFLDTNGQYSNYRGVPANFHSYSWPYSGSGYAVLILLFKHQSGIVDTNIYWDGRTYLAQKLNLPLEEDSTYCFSLRYKAPHRWGNFRIATNRLGVVFSQDSLVDYSFPTGLNELLATPSIELDSNEFITDTVSWRLFKRYYKAYGGEQFVTIGNFYKAAQTPILVVNPNLPEYVNLIGINVYIDDVRLYKNECPAETDTTQQPKPKVFSTLQLPSAFTPNNDGKNDVFRVLGSPQVSNFKLCVYNRWGKQVYCGNTIYEGWDGNCNGAPCEMATYVWVATYTDVLSGEQRVERGNVTLIR